MLSHAKIKGLRPGLHCDGNGLYLNVKSSGSKSWSLRFMIDGRRREMGLGSYPAIGLAKARAIAAAHRSDIAVGIDPFEKRHRASAPIFREAARKFHAANLQRWRSKKHADDWWATLERHAFKQIGHKPVNRIGREDMFRVLTPIWTSKAETARRVRQRIRAVLQWAVAKGYVKHNVAGEVLDAAFPVMPKVKEHLRALPCEDVAMALRVVESSAARLQVKLAFRFLVLTAARSGMVRGARWDEINLEKREWRIPAERMKANKEHRVPLSSEALAVLVCADAVREASTLVFSSPRRPGQALSDMSMTKLLRDVGLADRTTAHGFRSAFRVWASERTSAGYEVMEMCLAHTVGSLTERAYARSDLFDKRRGLMQQWSDYVTNPPAEVVVLYA